MDRDEILAEYERRSAAILTVLKAVRSCVGKTDFNRAADLMGILAGGKIVHEEGDFALQMLCDLATYHPDRRGVRPIDRFLKGPVAKLPDHERDIAHTIAKDYFSIFRTIGPHEVAGLWIEDLLFPGEPIWLLEQKMLSPDFIAEQYGTRICAMGANHAAVGVVVGVSDGLIRACQDALAATGRLPFRRPLAAVIYGLEMYEKGSEFPSAVKFVNDVATDGMPYGHHDSN